MEEKYHLTYNALFNVLKLGIFDGKSTSIYNSIALLFTADQNNPLKYSGICGILSLEVDRCQKSTFIRMYNIDDFNLVFQCELYYGFNNNYRMIDQFMYIFDFFDGIIGFVFRNKQQGENMKNKIQYNSPKQKNLESLKKEKIFKNKENQSKKNQANIFTQIYNFFTFSSQKSQIKGTQIIKVQKKKSIKFNAEKGIFEVQNIPQQWLSIFDQIGYSKKQLQDKQTANTLMEDIIAFTSIKEREQRKQKMKKEDKQEIYEKRCNLFKEIKEGFKLKPIFLQGKNVMVDTQKLRDEKQDLSQYLRNALKKRKNYIGRTRHLRESVYTKQY